MKKMGKICLLLCTILLVFHIAAPAFADEAATQTVGQATTSAAVSSGCHSVDAQVAMLGSSQLISNAQTVFLYERNSETLMYAWNADVKMAPSSLVKIMTAYLAAEMGNLSEIVTVKDSVIATVPANAVSAKLQVDEVITVEDLLYCMMVGSANDAAAVIADHICGSQDAFVEEMNAKAQELGCTGTRFVNVHGLHDAEQFTTARDVCRILTAALENDTFRTIFSTVTYTVPQTNRSEARELITGNYLMTQNDMQIYYDARVTGGRTGIANDGTRCLASIAEVDGMELISVVMGAADNREEGHAVLSFGGYSETKSLFDAGFDGYKAVQILYPGQIMMQRDVTDGAEKVSIGSLSSCMAVLPVSVTSNDLSYRYADVAGNPTAPIKQGSLQSNVQVWYGNICVAQADLYAMNAVYTQPVAQVEAIEDSGSDEWVKVLLVVLCVACGVFLVLIALRFSARLRAVKSRKRSRRYRRDRGRSQ